MIEDTVNFERNYHLGKIVQGRAKVHLESAGKWYSSELLRNKVVRHRKAKDSKRFHLAVFVRGVVSLLFSHDDFPETFYLDQDRLRSLRTALHDLVYFEICFDLFHGLLRRLGYHRSMSHNIRHVLASALSAILENGGGHSPQQWDKNCDHISLELVRHALHTCGFSHTYDAGLVAETTKFLRDMMHVSFADHAAILQESITEQVQACVNSHMNSTPLDLFNALVAPSNPPPPPPPPPQYVSATPQLISDTSSPHVDQLLDTTNRITHIILLHWRTWGPIVYVIPEDDQPLSFPSADSPKPANTDHAHSAAINHIAADEAQTTAPMAPASGSEPAAQESQTETQFAGSAPEAEPL